MSIRLASLLLIACSLGAPAQSTFDLGIRPPTAAPGQSLPTLVVLGSATIEKPGPAWRRVTIASPGEDFSWPALALRERLAHPPEKCRFHLVVANDPAARRQAEIIWRDHRMDVQTFVFLGQGPPQLPTEKHHAWTDGSIDLRVVADRPSDPEVSAAFLKAPCRSAAWLPATTRVGPLLAELRAARRITHAEEAELHALLDRLSSAATRAHFDDYFGLFTADGVFHGTDETERWPIATFREWARPHFDPQSAPAWTFVPVAREVAFGPDRRTAWFDETVVSTHLGPCRGTGAMVKTPAGWRITQYNLAMTVPNPLARGLVEIARSGNVEKPRRYALVPTTEGRAPGLALLGPLDDFTEAWTDDPTVLEVLRARGLAVVGFDRWGSVLRRASSGSRILIVASPGRLNEGMRLLGVTRETDLATNELLLVRQGVFGPPETTSLRIP